MRPWAAPSPAPFAHATITTHQDLLPQVLLAWDADINDPAAGPVLTPPQPTSIVASGGAGTTGGERRATAGPAAAAAPTAGDGAGAAASCVLELTLWPVTRAGGGTAEGGGGAEGVEWEEELAERLRLAAGTATYLPRLDQLWLTPAPEPWPAAGNSTPSAENGGEMPGAAAEAPLISTRLTENGMTPAKVYMVEVGPSEDLGSMVPEPGQLAAALIDAANAGRLLQRLPGYSAVLCRPPGQLDAAACAEEGQLLP